MKTLNGHNFFYNCPFETHYISKHSELIGESLGRSPDHDLCQKNASNFLKSTFKDQTLTFILTFCNFFFIMLSFQIRLG